jgi:hypothetical protein
MVVEGIDDGLAAIMPNKSRVPGLDKTGFIDLEGVGHLKGGARC